jgi:hypothetical protein
VTTRHGENLFANGQGIFRTPGEVEREVLTPAS